ncbi:sulfurtransferase complex subunit TusD [Halotalea alkalilenta]|uniref:sulfurtransferase complex subunit TusD n=1 Tax=Halotalea alkalilenta TaxID=376489 RepID=UPI003CCC211A
MNDGLRYTLLVMGAPYSRQASHSALRFGEALVAANHRLEGVFFYHDGVYNAARLMTPPQDEPRLASRWQALADASGARLMVCVASALKRGLLDAREAERHGVRGETLAPGFELAGLGQLVHATAISDRTLTFA